MCVAGIQAPWELSRTDWTWKYRHCPTLFHLSQFHHFGTIPGVLCSTGQSLEPRRAWTHLSRVARRHRCRWGFGHNWAYLSPSESCTLCLLVLQGKYKPNGCKGDVNARFAQLSRQIPCWLEIHIVSLLPRSIRSGSHCLGHAIRAAGGACSQGATVFHHV